MRLGIPIFCVYYIPVDLSPMNSSYHSGSSCDEHLIAIRLSQALSLGIVIGHCIAAIDRCMNFCLLTGDVNFIIVGNNMRTLGARVELGKTSGKAGSFRRLKDRIVEEEFVSAGFTVSGTPVICVAGSGKYAERGFSVAIYGEGISIGGAVASPMAPGIARGNSVTKDSFSQCLNGEPVPRGDRIMWLG